MKYIFMNHEDDHGVGYEDILTIMVIRFMLFMLILVPMVNVDKANLDKAQKDTFWQELYTKLQKEAPVNNPEATAYHQVFEYDDNAHVLVSTNDADHYKYIEVSDDKKNLLIVEIDTKTNKYISMYIQEFSNVITYHYGLLQRDPSNTWYSLNETIDYGENPLSGEMKQRYQQWAKSTKGL